MKTPITEEDIISIDKFVLDNYERYKDDTTWIVTDGVVDLDSYNQSKYQILWILKEVNEIGEGDDNSAFGDWDIRPVLKELKEGNKVKKGWANTFNPIVLATFGILNYMDWNDMDYINDDPSMIDVIKQIAYINIKKQPGRSVVNNAELNEFFERDKSVIFHQIDKFNPDIIIFGGTLNHLKEGLELKEENAVKLNGLNFYIQNDKIYIQAYHPGFRGRKEKYIDDIIAAVRYWESKLRVS